MISPPARPPVRFPFIRVGFVGRNDQDPPFLELTTDDMKRPTAAPSENEAARASWIIGVVFDDRAIANRLLDIASTDPSFTQPLGVRKRNDVVSAPHVFADDGQGLLVGHTGSLHQRAQEAERRGSGTAANLVPSSN